jgi:heptosyltransferase III
MPVRNILLVSLSNIGDVILTFPVFDTLCDRFPDAKISLVIGPKARGLFEDNPRVGRLFILEKRSSVKDKVRWLRDLRREKFDLVVDLRNSMLPFLVRSKRATRPALSRVKDMHMKDKHFRRLRLVVKDAYPAEERFAFYANEHDRHRTRLILSGAKNYVVVAPGAADHRKRWGLSRFAALIRHLAVDCKVRVVVVGDRKDAREAERMFRKLPGGVMNLCGLTTLKELGVILQGARLAILNDSGIMHLASYLNVPVVALFGPTDPALYGPWSRKSVVIRRGKDMDSIPVSEVVEIVDKCLI